MIAVSPYPHKIPEIARMEGIEPSFQLPESCVLSITPHPQIKYKMCRKERDMKKLKYTYKCTECKNHTRYEVIDEDRTPLETISCHCGGKMVWRTKDGPFRVAEVEKY